MTLQILKPSRVASNCHTTWHKLNDAQVCELRIKHQIAANLSHRIKHFWVLSTPGFLQFSLTGVAETKPVLYYTIYVLEAHTKVDFKFWSIAYIQYTYILSILSLRSAFETAWVKRSCLSLCLCSTSDLCVNATVTPQSCHIQLRQGKRIWKIKIPADKKTCCRSPRFQACKMWSQVKVPNPRNQH